MASRIKLTSVKQDSGSPANTHRAKLGYKLLVNFISASGFDGDAETCAADAVTDILHYIEQTKSGKADRVLTRANDNIQTERESYLCERCQHRVDEDEVAKVLDNRWSPQVVICKPCAPGTGEEDDD